MKCPTCNQDITGTPLLQLKRHLNSRIERINLEIKEQIHYKYSETSIQRKREALDKWESWLTAIEELERK